MAIKIDGKININDVNIKALGNLYTFQKFFVDKWGSSNSNVDNKSTDAKELAPV